MWTLTLSVIQKLIKLFLFGLSKFLKDFDPFGAQKQLSFTSSLQQIVSIAAFLSTLLQSSNTTSQNSDSIKVDFEHLVLVSS